MEIIIFLIIGTVLGAIGVVMAEDRNRSAAGGFFLGLFLGLIGLAIIALMGKLPNDQEKKSLKEEYELTETEIKDEKFLNYLKKNDPDKYESIAIKYQDNPVRMKKVLHAYQQELEGK